MALKALMLKRSIEGKKKQLEILQGKDADFEKRLSDLETAIDEVKAGDTDAEKSVMEEIEKFDNEKREHEQAKSELEKEIQELEKELQELEESEPRKNEKRNQQGSKGADVIKMDIRNLPKSIRAFDGLTANDRTAIICREDVRNFLETFRNLGRTRGSISGGELTIPVVLLDLIAENMYRYSKLMNRVRVRTVGGEARQTIAGIAPPAIWTEMCGALNELEFQFNQITMDGYKVGGYIPVCNSLLEDSDIDLASWIVEMLSESLGAAKDMAILYGKGSAYHMPMGIVTRLAQQEKPGNYPIHAPEWADLSATNIISIDGDNLDGSKFWSALTIATGNTFTRYSRGNQFWAMNSKTFSYLKSKAIAFDMYGKLTAAIPGIMPVIDGDIDILEFIPDGDIIGGYGDLYLWAQRSGLQIEYSRDAQFIQDNTVYRGKERADGSPIIAGAFVAINIKGSAPTTTINFPADNANDAQLQDLTISGATISPAFDATIQSYTATAPSGNKATILATPAQASANVSITVNGKTVVNGNEASFTAKAANTVVITVVSEGKTRVYTVVVTGA